MENFVFTSNYTLKSLKEETNKINGAAMQERYDGLLRSLKEREEKIYKEIEAEYRILLPKEEIK